MYNMHSTDYYLLIDSFNQSMRMIRFIIQCKLHIVLFTHLSLGETGSL